MNEKEFDKEKSYETKDPATASPDQKDCKDGKKGRRRRGKRGTKNGNHDSWYAGNAQIAASVANIGFPQRLGDQLMFRKTSGVAYANVTDAIPGIFRVDFMPVYGSANESSAPLNIASYNIYSYVRHANSGSRNYEAADMMLTFAAIDSLYMFVGCVARALSYTKTFPSRNAYASRAYLQAMGFDPDDLWANQANVESWLNTCIVRASSLKVPKAMPIFARHWWLCTNVFADVADPKAQVYMYVPRYLWTYEWNAEDTGTALYPLEVFKNGEALTFAQLRETWDTLFNKLMYNEDIGIISGDVMKAYGDQVIDIGTLSIDGINAPTVDEEALDMIQNSVLVPIGSEYLNSLKFTQSNGVIQFNFQQTVHAGNDAVGQSLLVAGNEAMLRFPDYAYATSSPYRIIRALSQRHVWNVSTPVATSAITATPVSFGAEIILAGHIYRYTSGGLQYVNVGSAIGDNIVTLGNYLTAIEPFGRHPLFEVVYYDSDLGQYHDIARLGDLCEYTFVSDDRVAAIHTTMMLSLLGVPAGSPEGLGVLPRG